MKLQFDNIINTQKGKTGFVLGLGHSLRDNLPIITDWQKDKSLCSIISCNNADVMIPQVDFDYWMLAQPADSENPLCITRAFERYNSRPSTTFLYTDCLDLTPADQVAELLNVNYIGYDQRHYNGEHCGWGNLEGGRSICCAGIDKNRLCIQEELKKLTSSDEMYGNADTVGIHMIALAVLLGMNPIYVSGIDLDYTNGYVNNDVNVSIEFRIELGKSVYADPRIIPRVLSDIAIIKRSAERIGTKIYCMNEGKLSSVLEVKRP